MDKEEIDADAELDRLVPNDISADEKIQKINELLKKKNHGSIKISKALKRRL